MLYFFGMRKTLISQAIICSMVFLFAPRADVRACSCVADRSLPVAYNGTNAVFEGRVIAVNKQFAWTLGATGYEAVYEVTRAWKGVTSKYVTVTTGTGGGDCGVSFALGGSSKMFFSGTGSSYPGISANICTQPFSKADVIAAYGPGTTDLKNNWWLLYIPSTWPLLVSALGAGALFLFGIWVKHHWLKPKK